MIIVNYAYPDLRFCLQISDFVLDWEVFVRYGIFTCGHIIDLFLWINTLLIDRYRYRNFWSSERFFFSACGNGYKAYEKFEIF